MKRVSYGERKLVMDGRAADALLQYAQALSQSRDSDTVRVDAVTTDGETIHAAVLLGAGTTIMVESWESVSDDPDNAPAIAYMQRRTELLTHPPHPPTGHPDDDAEEHRSRRSIGDLG